MRKITYLLLLAILCSNAQLYSQQKKSGSQASATNQTGAISGVVTDEKSEPIVGASVKIKGTSLGIITDVNGKFNFRSLPSGATIVVSFIGYVSQEIKTDGQSVIHISLSENTRSLDEVVVVGYGVMKKKDLTGSVASIKGDQIAAVPVANAAQALQGKLSGVNVTSQDGRPDASLSIRVRGGGSVSQSNEPLYIVDGFPVSSIANIPGNMIESIDVLKDASSTAIYGARGANGVVIVTTKNAKSGKVKVTYDGYGKYNTPTKYLPTMDAYNYVGYNWAYAAAIGDNYANAWEMLWGIGRFATTYNNTEGIDHYKNVATQDYARQAYKSSYSQSHNISVSGGSDQTKYLFSLNHVNEDGMKVNSWYKRTNATLKLDQKISQKINFNMDVRYSNVDKMGNEGTTNGTGSILSSAYTFRPIATGDVLGQLDDTKNSLLGMYDTRLQDVFNPVARMEDYKPESKERSLAANGRLSWNIIKGLTARSEIGLTSYWNKSFTWSGAIYNNYIDPSTGNKTYGGNATIGSSEGWGYRWTNTLTYDVQGLGKDHSLNILAGQEISNSQGESMTISGQFYPVSFDADRAYAMMNQYRTSSVTGTSVTNYFSYASNVNMPERMQSYFGRANYSMMDRYLLSATLRADGSSRFATSNRWGYFPAAALGWRLVEEKFIKDNLHWVDNLKLRLSYGTAGNDRIDPSLWTMQWKSDASGAWSLNENLQPIYSPASTTIANPDLKWETTITRNVGLDFGVLNNRIYGNVDVYWNSTMDLLMKTSVPAYTGFTYTYDNVGSTSNKGVELTLGADIVRSKSFNLNASFNINFNRGKIESLDEGVNGLYKTQWGSSMTQPNTGDYILKVGKPVGLVRGYQSNGWYTVDDFDYDATKGVYTLKQGVPDIGTGILGTVYGTTTHKPTGQTAYPGVMKLKDISGPNGTPDGVVNEYDVDVIGNMNPLHTGGFNIQGNYKNLDFALSFNWSYGNQIYNANYLAAMYGSKEDGLYKNRLDYLTGAYKIYDIQNGQLVSVTDPAALTALNAGATTYLAYQENPVVTSIGIENGSFLRLNNLTLGYSLPQSILKPALLSKVRFYGTIYNALTITKYSGLDPEVNTNTSQGGAEYPTTGMDWGTYPRSRSFVLGVNVEF